MKPTCTKMIMSLAQEVAPAIKTPKQYQFISFYTFYTTFRMHKSEFFIIREVNWTLPKGMDIWSHKLHSIMNSSSFRYYRWPGGTLSSGSARKYYDLTPNIPNIRTIQIWNWTSNSIRELGLIFPYHQILPIKGNWCFKKKLSMFSFRKLGVNFQFFKTSKLFFNTHELVLLPLSHNKSCFLSCLFQIIDHLPSSEYN